jgi:hypothetical protein
MTATTSRVDAGPPAEAPAAWRLPVAAAAGALGSVGTVVFGSGIGATPGPGAGSWWWTVPVGTSALAHVGFTASVVVVVAAWLAVGAEARAGRLRVGWAWALLALWGLPLLLGVPLFSRDLYSYVAQGQLAHLGHDPYAATPADLGPGPVLSSVASVWRHTASPYGPLFVAASRAVGAWAGPGLVAQILAYRALELIGVALVMAGLPALARQGGADPGTALWLGALSPLALWSFVSSAHNDTLMLGLLVAGLVVAGRGRLLVGVALCALAATVKLPALAAVAFLIGAEVARRQGAGRWRAVAAPLAVAAAVVAGVTLAAGYGWAWLGPAALRIPAQLRVLTTPVVSVGSFLWGLLHLVGVPVGLHATVTVVQVAAEAAALAGAAWLLSRSGRYRTEALLGCALLLFVACSPTVWPWYWTWPLAVLAATGAQRSRWLAALATGAMLVVGAGGTPLLTRGDWWIAGPLLVTGAVVVATGGRWRTLLGEPTGGR